MSELSHKQYLNLQAMGREPISLPAEIYFAGNEILQKSPGGHHLPQFRETGTFNHPSLKAQRKRVAMDKAKRILNMKMTEVELRQSGGLPGIKESLKEHGLTINEKQWEIAKMNADNLTLEGEARRAGKVEGRKILEEKLGKPVEEIKADEAKPIDPIAAAMKASAISMLGDNDLSSNKSEEEKDREAKLNPQAEEGEEVSFENLDS